MEQNKVPKNIRQIGENEDWIRVYIEDYVYTYIQRLRNGQNYRETAGGILLGTKQRINGVMHLFIKGAVLSEDPYWRAGSRTPEQLRMENSIYFPGLDICGFFLSGMERQATEMELSRIFERSFRQENQVLFEVCDREEAMSAYSGHGIVKMAGYYVYYEKNDEMQSYIIRRESLRMMDREPVFREEKVQEKAEQPVQKEPIKVPFKRRQPKKKLSKGELAVRIVSVAGIVILGFLLFSDQVRFSNINEAARQGENLIGGLLNESEGAVQAGADAQEESGTGESGESVESEAAETGESSLTEESESESLEVLTPDGNRVHTISRSEETTKASQEETTPPESRSTVNGYVFPRKYLVKKGDSLYSISEKYYGTTEMVDAICLENNISDPSRLQSGVIITLPLQ